MRPPLHQPSHEATEAQPWAPGDPPAHVHTYPYSQQPLLWIYTLGRWRYAVVHARHTSTGLIAYQVDININDQTPGNYSRTYQWDPACMRIIPRE